MFDWNLYFYWVFFYFIRAKKQPSKPSLSNIDYRQKYEYFFFLVQSKIENFEPTVQNTLVA
jgi:hypothetical protein